MTGTVIKTVVVTETTTQQFLRGAFITSVPTKNERLAEWEKEHGMLGQVIRLDTPYEGLGLAMANKETKGILSVLGRSGTIKEGTRVIIKRADRGSEALLCTEIALESGGQ